MKALTAHTHKSTRNWSQKSLEAGNGSEFIAIMDLIMAPVRVATSKPARQTYLNTVLFMITSAILLGLAALAYILFYFNYVPQIGIVRIIHLQYGDGPHPYGITSLDSSLVSQQAYDISLSLHVPRSPPNLAQGNFMLSLSLLSPNYRPPVPSLSGPLETTLANSPPSEELLFFSRRPAILTYASQLVSLSSQVFSLPLYMVGLKKESEVLHIPMGESATFNKGWKNVPAYARLELQAGQEVQVYDVQLQFIARFSGLRWMMYNHRILSFIIFTTAFWGMEITFATLGWLVLQAIFAPKTDPKKDVKGEETDATTIKAEGEETDEPDLSDTPRTFPTYGRQPPLRYEPKIKDEADSEDYILDETTIQPPAAEADDEGDDDGEYKDVRGGRTDSGIGTSFSETAERTGVQRRRSRVGRAGR